MGMLDQEIMLSDGQTATAVGDTSSVNSYDTGGTNGQGDFGETGENLWFQIRVQSTATSGGAATVQGVVQVSDDNITYIDSFSGPAIPVANATAGAILLRTQPPVPAYGTPSRYFRAVIRIAGATLTAGKFDAYVSNTIQHNTARKNSFTVA